MEFLDELSEPSAPTPFMCELKRIVERSQLSYRQIARGSESQLSRALHGTLPRRDTLMDWCRELYRREAITQVEANQLLNLAGYATPKQHEKALTRTTEHHASLRNFR